MPDDLERQRSEALGTRGVVPSLATVLADPTLVERLPRRVAIEYRRTIKRLDVDLEAHIAASLDRGTAVREAEEPEEPDRAVGLTDAAAMLGIKRRTLEREPKWRLVGGYRDIDGRIKFRLSDLRRHMARRRTTVG